MPITVVLSTYDGAAHLDEQLASLAAQRALPDALVVRDDHSSDATVDTLERFAASAPFRVQVAVGSSNLGAVRSFERALSEAIDPDTGAGGASTDRWIALCDQDDVWHPDKLAVLGRAAARDRRTTLVFSDAALIDETGRSLAGSTSMRLGLSGRRLERFRAEPLLTSLERSLISGCTTLLRADVVAAGLPFPSTVTDQGDTAMLHDRWLTLLAAALGWVTYVGRPLVDYRQHASQHTGFEPSTVARVRDRTRTDAGWSERLEQRAGQLDALVDRAAEAGADQDRLDGIRAAASHLRARGALARQPRTARLPAVVGELRAGSYRWSDGAAAALADLVRR